MIFILLYFICGIFFVSCIFPILEELTQVILTALEWIKRKIMVSITAMNVNMQKIVSDEDKIKEHPIGFTAVFSDQETTSTEEVDDNV